MQCSRFVFAFRRCLSRSALERPAILPPPREQAHPELAGSNPELQELTLAIEAIGGTRPFWDMDMVKQVVGENVKVALQRTATRHDDYRVFHNPH